MARKRFTILTAILLLVPFVVFGGSYEETLHEMALLESGGYGAPVFKYAQVGGEFATVSGARGAWIINHSFAVGAGYYRLVSDIDEAMSLTSGRNISGFHLEYSGIELEYITHSESVTHFVFYILAGGGNLMYSRYNSADDKVVRVTDDLLIVEPGLGFQINVTEWSRVDLGVSYRLAMGVEDKSSRYLGESNMSGVCLSLALKFGNF